jgi:hypothetical protein
MGCDIHAYAEVRKDGIWTRHIGRLRDDRDYRSFALFAGVRNYEGAAFIEPISEPRGLPTDCVTEDNSLEYENPHYVWLGDHSFSWLLLSELEKVDWLRPIVTSGYVKNDMAERFKQYGVEPQAWCQGVSHGMGYQWIEWTKPLAQALHLAPRLTMDLRKLGAPDDVRMVFGFDN